MSTLPSERRVPDQEHVYDARISPLVTQILAICRESGMPFVASFEYAPGKFCSTASVPADASPLIHHLSDAILDNTQGARLALSGALA